MEQSAGSVLTKLIGELTGSLSEEQQRVVSEIIQQGGMLLQKLAAAQKAGQEATRAVRAVAEAADIPDMRGRMP